VIGRLLGGAALALVVLAAGCGEDDANADKGKKDDTKLEDVVKIDGSEADVTVLDNTFNDENIEVAPGTKVVWTNDGRQNHDIVPVDDSVEFGVEPGDFEPETVYEYVFDKPGTYRYYCSLHGTEDAGMIGAVVVK
jgi:plastocyanin